MNNNMSGKISMNPKELYNVTLTGVDLESRVSENFQKMNDAFESILQAVKTPELNQKVVALYDIFKQVETNFNQNNRIVNDFFSKKLQEYNAHALNITEASSNLSSDLGFTNNGTSTSDNTFTSDVDVSNDAVNNEPVTLDFKIDDRRNPVNNDFAVDSGISAVDNNFVSNVDMKSDALNNRPVTLDVKRGNDFINNGSNVDSDVISLDPREWKGFNKSDI